MTRYSMIWVCVIATVFAGVAHGQSRDKQDQELIKQLDIENVDKMHGLTFEIYVCKLLQHQGYVTQDLPPARHVCSSSNLLN